MCQSTLVIYFLLHRLHLYSKRNMNFLTLNVFSGQKFSIFGSKPPFFMFGQMCECRSQRNFYYLQFLHGPFRSEIFASPFHRAKMIKQGKTVFRFQQLKNLHIAQIPRVLEQQVQLKSEMLLQKSTEKQLYVRALINNTDILRMNFNSRLKICSPANAYAAIIIWVIKDSLCHVHKS